MILTKDAVNCVTAIFNRSYLMLGSLTKVNESRLIWIRRLTMLKLNYKNMHDLCELTVFLIDYYVYVLKV